MPGRTTSGLPVSHGHEGCLPETPQLCCHSDTRWGTPPKSFPILPLRWLSEGILSWQWTVTPVAWTTAYRTSEASQAPQPHDPDASMNKCLSGDFKRRNGCTDVPGHCSRRESHQASSEWAARLRHPTLPGLTAAFVAKRALRNVLPSGKIVTACTRWPTRDFSACLFEPPWPPLSPLPSRAG